MRGKVPWTKNIGGQKYYRCFLINEHLKEYSMKLHTIRLFLPLYDCGDAFKAAFSHGCLICRAVTFLPVDRPTKKSAMFIWLKRS